MRAWPAGAPWPAAPPAAAAPPLLSAAPSSPLPSSCASSPAPAPLGQERPGVGGGGGRWGGQPGKPIVSSRQHSSMPSSCNARLTHPLIIAPLVESPPSHAASPLLQAHTSSLRSTSSGSAEPFATGPTLLRTSCSSFRTLASTSAAVWEGQGRWADRVPSNGQGTFD